MQKTQQHLQKLQDQRKEETLLQHKADVCNILGLPGDLNVDSCVDSTSTKKFIRQLRAAMSVIGKLRSKRVRRGLANDAHANALEKFSRMVDRLHVCVTHGHASRMAASGFQLRKRELSPHPPSFKPTSTRRKRITGTCVANGLRG